MRSILLAVGLLALLAVCACAPLDGDVIQHIPQKAEQTPSLTGKDGSASTSGAAEDSAAAGKPQPARVRREAAQENDLLPAGNDVDVSPYESSNLEGRGRIRVLPAFLG